MDGPSANTLLMPGELAAAILRKSVGSMSRDRTRCGECRRTPVAGELLHRLESGTALCSLCFGRLPESERGVVQSERVHASERPVSVTPRAA